jgi:hypothetical protein
MYWACNLPCKRRMRTEPNDIKRKAISSYNGPDRFREHLNLNYVPGVRF